MRPALPLFMSEQSRKCSTQPINRSPICHAWWQRSHTLGICLQVRIFTSMDLIDTKDGKKILRQYDHTLVAETWALPFCCALLCVLHI